MTKPTLSFRERAVLTLVLGTVFGYLLFCAREPLRLNWGDPWSDANVLTALNYSSRYGFWKTSFTDVLDVGPLTADSYRYTHYPPLAEILYGCVRKLAGGSPLDISVYRFFAVAFAGLGIHSFYRYVGGVWGKSLAVAATVLCATNLLWLQYADSIHQSPILFATGMTALAAVPGWVRERRRLHAVVLAVSTYLCFLVAYDYYFFLPIAALLTARILGVPLVSKRMLKLAAIIAASGLASIATKSAFVIGALGWHGFVDDIAFQFLERATTTFAPDYRTGFLVVLLSRWTSYFTPLFFFVALALVASLLREVVRRKLVPSVRELLLGTSELNERAASVGILLVAALPFVIVFSELSVEQVLASQVLVPFYAVACAWAATRLGQRDALAGAVAVAALVGWQAFHFARVPKSFLERAPTRGVADFLKKHDTSDFLVTNLIADGQVQYYFDRHFHPPSDAAGHAISDYDDLASRTPSGVIHAVLFEDPETRFIDKSLWPILVRQGRWLEFGYPYLFRDSALGAVAEWDRRVLQGLEEAGEEVMRAPGIRVFKLGKDIAARRAERMARLNETTRAIDFGTPEAEVHKLAGFRYREKYPDVPGFCWTVGRGLQRTVLTRRGLIFKSSGPRILESDLLVRFDASASQRVSLITWGSINDQTLSASIDGTTVLPTTNLGPGQTRTEVSFTVPKELLGGDPVKDIVFRFRDVADFGGGVAFAIMRIEPDRGPRSSASR